MGSQERILARAEDTDFLIDDGEMAGRIRTFDWASTPLGPIEHWPQSLKTATGIVVASRVPIVMLWGEPGVMIYNDAYSVFAGGRHPTLLGSNVREGWPEVADFNDNVMRVGLAGGTLAYKDQELTLHRHGRPEQVWMNLDYWPVPGEDGRPAGVMATVVETTERVVAERAAALEQERQRDMLRQMPGFAATMAGPDHVFDYFNDAYAEISGGRVGVGKSVREVFPELEGQGFFELLDRVYATGEPFFANGVPIDLADRGRRYLNFVYEPVRDAAGAVSGVFVGGYDTTEALTAVAALADSETRYRALFDAIGSGFCIIEMKFDAAMRPVDYMIVEGNAAFAEMTGLHGADGKWVSDIAPGLEQHWFDLYGHVALSGETARFENPADIFGRWYDVEALRIGDPDQHRVAIVFNNITERKQFEARQDALIRLGDAIRDLTDPEDIAFASAEVLAQALGVDRAGYGVMDVEAETITIARDYNAPGVVSIAGTLKFRDFGSYIEDLKAGETVLVTDATTDPRTRDTAQALLGINAASFINMPLMEQGRVVALVFANHGQPRQWSAGDEELMRAVADRVRAASERARATRALAASEARLRFLDRLSQAVTALSDPDDILAVITRITGEQLGVTNCAYADMDPDEDGFTIRGDWAAPGSPSIVGHYSLADFGALAVRELGAGRPLIVNDNLTELAPQEAATFQAIGIGATICMPLVKEGRLTALMAIHHKGPHRWTDEELATIREVTERSWAHIERVGAEAERRLSESRYRALFEAIDEGFCIIEFIDGPAGPLDDYVHVEANAAYTVNAGIPDVVGQKVRAMVGPEADEWIERYRGVLVTGQPIRFEKELEKTGRWLELAAFRVEPRSRNQVAVLFKDLTAKKQAERQLHQLNSQLEVLLEGSKAERDRLWTLSEDMLGRADYAGGMVAVNPAWTKVLGWSEDELLTNPYADIISPEDLPRTTAALERMGQTGQPTRFENRILTKAGVWAPIGWTVAPEPDGVHFIAVGRDLTEDKARQGELQVAQEALRQAQKMEAVGQLTGGIAHDFNNLLAGISGSLELLNKRMAEGRLQGMERYIDAAQGAAQRAASLTQRLLAFSRRQTLDPRVVDANRLIAGMEDLVRRTVGPAIELEVVGAGGLWPVRVDPSQLENALLNLCINARDAMNPGGGHLTIETANKWLDDRAARARDLSPGQYVSVCVSDTGTGIAPELVERIFEPFFTTKPTGQGTGLGLSMIHGFIRQSGGQVRVYSEAGKGTTMCLYLPRYVGDLAVTEDADGVYAAAPAHGETVLVIDDEPTVRMLVVEVLEDAGYAVLEAQDGASGLRILDSEARIDLLITDVGLPGGMNGREVAEAARGLRPELKILFITGYAENAAVRNGLLDPGMSVMTKPFVMGALADKVREIIDGEG